MKKFLFILPLIMAPAHAELTKCVYLNPEMTCTAGGEVSSYRNAVDWDATCTDSIATTKITAIGRCAATTATAMGTTADETTTEDSNKTQINCWCKILTPAVSQWVYHSTATSQGECAQNCAMLCVQAITEYGATDFKTAMFNQLGA